MNETPRHGLRFQYIVWMLLCAVMISSGCKKKEEDGIVPDSEAKTETEPIKQIDPAPALVMMQRDEFQQAIDFLAKSETAEAAYLRAVAFHKLKKHEASITQIETALKLEGDNPKYQAWRAVFRFSKQEIQGAKTVLTLADESPANASIIYASYYAHQVLSGLAARQKKPAESASHLELAKQALRKSADLAAAIPEFQREMLDMAVILKETESTRSLMDRLKQVSPNDESLLPANIMARLNRNADPDTAKRARAAQQFDDAGEDEAAALQYAYILSNLRSSRDNDTAFVKLVLKFPQNLQLRTMLVVYFVKADQFQRAMQELDLAIQEITAPDAKQELLLTAVMMPIEKGDRKFAEAQLEQYRSQISNEWMVKYFEARLLHMKKKRTEAIQLFKEVGQHMTKTVGSNDKLAKEALYWAAKVEAEQNAILND